MRKTLSARPTHERFTLAAVTAVAAEIAGDHDRGAVLAAQAIELAEQLDDPVCLVWAAWTAAREGGAAAGVSYASRAVEIARERGVMTALSFALQMQADGLIGQSRFELAYATAEEGWRLALDIGQPWAAPGIWRTSRRSMRCAAPSRRRVRTPRTCRHYVATSGASLVTAHLERALGLLELGCGRPAAALDRLLVAIAAARYESHPLFVLALPDAVEAAARADRLSEVAEPLGRFQSWVERFPRPARLALLARCRAWSTSLMPAGTLSRRSSSRTRCHRSTGPGPNCSTESGCDGRTDASTPGPISVRRSNCFSSSAVSPWEARARSELRASGETARKRDPSTRDQLTPQELQISRLVAAGKTNPEIAAQLFLSPRTIDYHLRKVFAKLEIASRAELAGVDLGEPVTA